MEQVRAWTVTLDPSRVSDALPTFLRIARAVADDVKRGRLRAGDALPGSRSLAEALGVHRNTVLAAYRELEAEGWIVTERARGTFVSPQIPELSSRRALAAGTGRSPTARAGFDLPTERDLVRHAPETLWEHVAPSPPALLPGRGSKRSRGPLSLAGGVPDVRLVPAAEVSRAIRRVLSQRPDEVLSYGDPEGPRCIRRALAEMIAATRAIAVREENVIVTRGSQMGLDLVARTLLRPGDVVAVEALGYRPAWVALAAAGARLVPIPVDAHGVDVAALERLAAGERLRGIYVTPQHQYPTTVTLAPARRIRLLELARARRIFVLEDDYDHEFHYEGRPILPLASADAHGVVVYVGTLSKVLAPAMRVGFVVAPEPLVARLAAVRRFVDRQGDHVLEHALAELLDEGAVQRHIRRARRIYGERRAHLAALLRAKLDGILSFRMPPGGTAIWVRVDAKVDADAWASRAARADLVLQPGRRFAFDGRARPFFRIGFAQNDASEAEEAVARLVRTMP